MKGLQRGEEYPYNCDKKDQDEFGDKKILNCHESIEDNFEQKFEINGRMLKQGNLLYFYPFVFHLSEDLGAYNLVFNIILFYVRVSYNLLS